ncbi:MAG: zf-HC2 domain-containing protein [Candidatus Zhuqueibacterota bacterium]
MKSCKHFRNMIWLRIYGELSEQENAELAEHIAQCTSCQLDYEEALSMNKVLDKKIQYAPDENVLKELRNDLHLRLLSVRKPNRQIAWTERLWRIISLDFSPFIRMGTAVALVIVGMFIGSKYFQMKGGSPDALKKVSDNSIPKVTGVEFIDFNPATHQIEITFNTMQDVTVEGDLNTPEIQKILAQMLMADNRPNFKLRTVRALESSARLENDVLQALATLVETDENPGIRLKAMKVLTAAPVTPKMKNLMTKVAVKVLLNDTNSAMRIEAFNYLGRINNGYMESDVCHAVKADSSEYIRTKSSHLLDRRENPQF